MTGQTTSTLAWVLIHFLWQGALVALLAGLASAVLRNARSTTRYALFSMALGLMALAPVLTWIALQDGPAPNPPRISAPPMADAAAPADLTPLAAPGQPEWFGWVVGLWLAGVGIFSVRSAGGWLLAQRLKWKCTHEAGDAVQRIARRMRARMAVSRAVRVLESASAEVPAVIGWIRPVILLPASALTALSPEQIELLVAHELAHIRRHDYLVNLLQTAIENVLFYHPAVWWVSGQIRAEREHCCDDLAVQACGSAIVYARALAALEGLRSGLPELAMAADGGSLLGRIQRLLKRPTTSRLAPPAWVGALLPVAVVLAAVLSVRPDDMKATPVSAQLVDPAPLPAAPADPPALAGAQARPEEAPEPAPRSGFLGGLADAGYTNISVDEIIALKENGVDPRYIKDMKAAGLGTPGVRDLIRLHQNGVDPAYVAAIVKSDLVADLNFENAIKLREHGVDTGDMGRIRSLGFGPFPAEVTIKLRDNGVSVGAFEALKEAGISEAGWQEVILVQQHGITASSIRSMKAQGFGNLTLEQIIKLKRAGVI